MAVFYSYQDSGLDDWDKDKNYVQIGFRPGFAVQARELTQMQTILQAQITALARRFMQSGSLVDANLTLASPSSPNNQGLWTGSISPGYVYIEPTGKDVGYFVNNKSSISFSAEATVDSITRVYVLYEEVQVNAEGDDFPAQGGFSRVTTDSSLFDNAQGFSNASAPGASRYQINILGMGSYFEGQGNLPVNAAEVFYIQNIGGTCKAYYSDTGSQIN
tara:strand:+ start:343 stop:996 length:654 start_codon:yes stop_codon:yes gene_type:complete